MKLKKLLLCAGMILASTSTWAMPRLFSIHVDITSAGVSVSSPTVIVKEGETALITQTSGSGEQTYFEVKPNSLKKDGKSAVGLQLTIGVMSTAGGKTVLSSPGMVVYEGKEATLTLDKKQTGTQDLVLKFMVKRKVL